MNKTSIEWVINPDGSPGYTWNPVVGCTNGCSYCYARRVAKRFGKCELCRSFTPHLHEERLDQPLKRKKPATIFLGSMCDMWDPNVPLAWRLKVWDVVRRTPQHTYLVLTKQPRNFTLGEERVFDYRNFWIGVTVTGIDDEWRLESLGDWPAENSFVSFEPLLSYIAPTIQCFIGWAIIGAQTAPKQQPVDWWLAGVKHILDRRPTPVFAKDNLDWPAELGPKPRELPYLANPPQSSGGE